jgi:uncharacterized protein (DUF1015 family)
MVMNGRSQTGLVCASSVDDYEDDVIKKHEFTRPEKELDRSIISKLPVHKQEMFSWPTAMKHN